MSRRSPKKSALRRTSRRASNRGPILVTVLGAVAIVGLIGYLAMRPVQSVQPAGSAASTQVAMPNRADASSQPVALPAKSVGKTDKAVPTQASAKSANDTRSMTAAKPASPVMTAAERRTRVEAQLAAGEFGPALEIAKSAADAGERTALLKAIASAQAKSGDYVAADRAISRIPIPESRERAGADVTAARQSAAGGAASAAQLISLIKNRHRNGDRLGRYRGSKEAAHLLAPRYRGRPEWIAPRPDA